MLFFFLSFNWEFCSIFYIYELKFGFNLSSVEVLLYINLAISVTTKFIERDNQIFLANLYNTTFRSKEYDYHGISQNRSLTPKIQRSQIVDQIMHLWF